MKNPLVLLLLTVLVTFSYSADTQTPTCDTAIPIADSMLIASSEEQGYERNKVTTDKGPEGAAWCAKSSDAHPFLEIRLEKPTVVGKMAILPPVMAPNTFPKDFITSFDLKFKLDDGDLVNAAKGLPGVSINKTHISSPLILLSPPQKLEILRIEPKSSHGRPCFRTKIFTCDMQTLCPPNFCKHGGKCSGTKTCECPDGFFGSQCQYTASSIPKTITNFIKIESNTIVTTSIKLNIHGAVTLTKDNGVNVIVIPSASSVDLPISPTAPLCLQDLDQCTAGFSISVVFRFNKLDEGVQYVISNGGGLKDINNVKGVQLFFQNNTVFGAVGTSRELWIIQKPVTPLVEAKWYEMTITWSPGKGLELLQGGKRIESSVIPRPRPATVFTGKPVLGSVNRVTNTVLTIRQVMVVSVFWKEAVRAGVPPIVAIPSPTTVSTTTMPITSPVASTTELPGTGCDGSKKDIFFKNTTETRSEVVTSLGKIESHGETSIEREGDDFLLVLDQQGEYVVVSNTGYPCIDDITTCSSNLTYRITFRFNQIQVKPNFILSSGGDLLNSTGIALYYFHESINFWVKDGAMVWMALYSHKLHLDTWYTMDASWSHTEGIQLRINGNIITPRIKTGHPASPVKEKHPLHIARSPLPEKNVTSIMDVLVFRVWTKTVEELIELNCTQDLVIKNPPPRSTPTTAATIPTTAAQASTTPAVPVTETKITFVKIVGTTIVTTFVNFTIHGTVKLEKVPAGNVLVIDKPGSYIDFGKTGIPCIDDVSTCTSGFNFRLIFSLIKIENRPQILISSGADTNQGKGITVRYFNKQIVVYFKRSTDTIVGIFPYELVSTFWYTLDVSWSVKSGLLVHVNNVETRGTIKTILHPRVQVVYTLLLGKSPLSNVTTLLKVFEINVWTRIYTKITHKRLVLPDVNNLVPATPDPNEPTTTALPQTTTMEADLTSRVPGSIPDFTFTFTNKPKMVLVSHRLTLTVQGAPDFTSNGVNLHNPNQTLKIQNLKNSCLTNPDICNKGVTFEIKIKLEVLEENSIIFTSGGHRPNAPGITLIYRYGQIHVIASTTTKAWYLTVSRHVIWQKGFVTIHVSWSQITALKLYVNQILVGVSSNPITHVNTTTSILTDLTIGGGPVRCIIKEVHIWLVHIDILINIGVVNEKGTTLAPTTLKPTAPTTREDTTNLPTTVQPTTTAEPTSTEVPKTTEPTTATTKKATTQTTTPMFIPSTSPHGQCPAGCLPKDECPTLPPTTTPTSPPKTTTKATPTTTPTTSTTSTSTTSPTTTTSTTTTPKTTTTSTTSTTTPIGCPRLISTLQLMAVADNNGQTMLMCVLSQVPDANMEVQFKWYVQDQHNEKWIYKIQNPDKGAPLMVSSMGVSIINKKIQCSATARYLVQDAKWCSNKIESNVIHAVVKLTHVDRITVVEGQGNQTVDVKTTVPPSSLCKPEDDGKCVVYITTVFHTERRELMCNRHQMIPQAVLGVSTVGPTPVCGIVLTKDNWNKGISIPVKANIDNIIDRDVTRKLTVSVSVTGEITGQTYSIVLGVVDVRVINRDKRAICSSVNDPHMTTFDRLRYNNHIPGEFVLYRHTTLEYEVRTLYRLCNRNRRNGPTCNFGVAVRSGDDVISFTTGSGRARRGRSTIIVQAYLNGELTPGTIIRRFGCGQKYEVLFPTGATVTIAAATAPFINVYVKASSVDFDKTEGLCGRFNGHYRDDLMGVSSRHPNSFSLKWKMTVSIFKGVGAISIPPFPVYCSCQSNKAHACHPRGDVYRCVTISNSITDITTTVIRSAQKSTVTSGGRRKRAAIEDEFDDEVPEGNSTAYTSESATEYCTKYLENNENVKKCEAYLDVNQTSASIRNCAEDLKDLGDKVWAASHLEHIIEECLTEVKRNPDHWTNSTDGEDPQPPLEIINNLCQVDCGMHGNCSDGVCECDDGWTGEKCDIGQNTKPIVIKATTPCDAMDSTSACHSVKIEGDNFVRSPNLKCTFAYVNIDNNVTSTGEIESVDAEYISMFQVICPQPMGRHASAARSARVSVSNDGQTKSDQYHLHVVYKSTCQLCNMAANQDQTKCVYLQNSCVIDGECYARLDPFERDDCYRCDPSVSKTSWTKISDPRCTVTIPPSTSATQADTGVKSSAVNNNDDDNHTVIIILGAVCAALALVIIIAALMVYRMQNRGKKEQLLQHSETKQSSFDIGRSKVTTPFKTGDVYEMPDASRLNTYVNPSFEEE